MKGNYYFSEFADKVRIYEDRLSRTERQIADYILKHENEIGDFSVQALADASGVGVASIIRLSKTLGYKGYADMKFQIQQGKLVIDNQDIGVESEDDINIIKQKALHFLQHSLEKCILDLDNDALGALSDIVANSKKVSVYGSGTAACIAQAVTSTFMNMGIYATSIQDSMLHLRSVAYMDPGDVLFVINYSGYSKDLGDCLYNAQSKGVTTVLLTSRQNSLLGKYADFEFTLPPRDKNNAVNVGASSICQIAIIQIIQAILQQKDLARVKDMRARLKGHSAYTFYDVKQESIYPGRCRIAETEQ